MQAKTRFIQDHVSPIDHFGAAVIPQRQHYRPDIDGVRAIAVLAVLAFHAFPQILPGGFAGVDVFFVISGYLISGIILSELRDHQFSFADFYRRRIRRIFPALAIVLGFCLVFGWWALLPAEYRQLGTHVAAGAGFVSNLQLWSESGYFDTSAEFKPLLHLWSLGVEEQYYLVWPLLLFSFRRRLDRLGWKIWAMGLGSFAVSLLLLKSQPTAAFYWPISRFWELLVGSMLAYRQIRASGLEPIWEIDRNVSSASTSATMANVMAFAGAGLIVTAFVELDQRRDFPGFWALLPSVGTALLIQAGPKAWFNRVVLASRSLVFVGLISYPLYLWHWPLLTYARILYGEPAPLVRLSILVLSGLLAWTTYRLVELKVRARAPAASRRRVLIACVSSVLMLGVAGLLGDFNVLRARSASIPHLAAISEAFSDRTYRGDKVLHGDTEESVMFFGDSHMQQYLPRIEAVMREHRAPVRTVVMWTGAGCAPLPGLDRAGKHCEDFVEKGFRLAAGPNMETVVIAASWVGMTERKDYYAPGAKIRGRVDLLAPESSWILEGFENDLRNLIAAGKHVVIVLSSPRGESFSPSSMVQRSGFDFKVTVPPPVPRARLVAEDAYIDNPIKQIAQRVGAEIIDPMDLLCTAEFCPTLDENGNPLFIDETHLRSTVARTRFSAFDRYVYLTPQPGSARIDATCRKNARDEALCPH